MRKFFVAEHKTEHIDTTTGEIISYNDSKNKC